MHIPGDPQSVQLRNATTTTTTIHHPIPSMDKSYISSSNRSHINRIPPSLHRFTHLSIHPSIHVSIHVSINPSVHQSIHLYTNPSTRPSIHPFIFPYGSFHFQLNSLHDSRVHSSMTSPLDLTTHPSIVYCYIVDIHVCWCTIPFISVTVCLCFIASY